MTKKGEELTHTVKKKTFDDYLDPAEEKVVMKFEFYAIFQELPGWIECMLRDQERQ